MLTHAASCVGVEFGFGAELKWTHHGIPQLKGTENKLQINVTLKEKVTEFRNWVSHRRIVASPWAPVQVVQVALVLPPFRGPRAIVWQYIQARLQSSSSAWQRFWPQYG